MDIPPMPAMVESISEAKAHFSSIVNAVEYGKSFVICRAGKPVAMMTPYTAGRGVSRIGLLKDRLAFDKGWWKRDRAADKEIENSFS